MDGHLEMSHLQVPKHVGPSPQDEPNDLEELEQFAKSFKQRRIKLGFTQVGDHFGLWSPDNKCPVIDSTDLWFITILDD